jgi:hypothetical protein
VPAWKVGISPAISARTSAESASGFVTVTFDLAGPARARAIQRAEGSQRSAAGRSRNVVRMLSGEALRPNASTTSSCSVSGRPRCNTAKAVSGRCNNGGSSARSQRRVGHRDEAGGALRMCWATVSPGSCRGTGVLRRTASSHRRLRRKPAEVSCTSTACTGSSASTSPPRQPTPRPAPPPRCRQRMQSPGSWISDACRRRNACWPCACSEAKHEQTGRIAGTTVSSCSWLIMSVVERAIRYESVYGAVDCRL